MIAVETREDGLRIVILGLIGFAMIFPLSLWRYVEPIEADLLDRCTEVLASESLIALDVTVSGRDITLTGTVGSKSQREQILEKVESVFGVRSVRDQIRIKGRSPGDGG